MKTKSRRGRDSKPHVFVDALRIAVDAGSDCELSVKLGFCMPFFCKIRNNRFPITDELILVVHEETNWSIKYIKELRSQCINPLPKEKSNGNKERSSGGSQAAPA